MCYFFLYELECHFIHNLRDSANNFGLKLAKEELKKKIKKIIQSKCKC